MYVLLEFRIWVMFDQISLTFTFFDEFICEKMLSDFFLFELVANFDHFFTVLIELACVPKCKIWVCNYLQMILICFD